MVKELKLTHPVAVLGRHAERPYYVPGYPLYVLVDRSGRADWVGVAEKPGRERIERLLAEGD